MKSAPSESSSVSSAPPPAYSETLSSPTPNPPTYATSQRAPRIIALVNDPIMKHVHDCIRKHVFSSTLILVPSDASTLMNVNAFDPYSKPEPGSSDFEFDKEQVVGFPANERITLVRLSGSDKKIEYWRPASIIRELSATLSRALELDGYNVTGSQQGLQLPPRDSLASPSLVARSVEWKAVQHPPLAQGEARSSIEFQEVTLRIANEMGLYETRSGMALVVKTEVGIVDHEEAYY